MRRAIRDRLIDTVHEVHDRVYEPHMAGPNVMKPYIVVKMGVESPAGVRNAFTKFVTVWVYTERTSFNELDKLVTVVRNTLNHVTLETVDGFKFELRYIGPVGEDYYDTEWQALGQGLRFEVPVIYE